MKQARFTESQIVGILAQAAGGDMTARDVCNIHGRGFCQYQFLVAAGPGEM